jgi:hypothetical protein
LGKSANRFKSAINCEEIWTVKHPLFISTRDKMLIFIIKNQAVNIDRLICYNLSMLNGNLFVLRIASLSSLLYYF